MRSGQVRGEPTREALATFLSQVERAIEQTLLTAQVQRRALVARPL
jgi:hypothetical protein